MKTLATLIFASAISAQAQTPALKAFDSPEAAAEAAIAAAENNDRTELVAIFGVSSKAILSTGNPEQDKQERAEFARVARAAHHIEKDPMNMHRVILDVGPDDWPFPVPIVEQDGKWSFDPDQGDLEVRARRIGANELDTIEDLAGIVQAQHQFALADHDADGILEYAQYIASAPGKTDGLVPPDSPIAAAEVRMGKSKVTPYHGYYYRILEAQGPHADGGAHAYVVGGKHMMGGFAVVAWPAEYGVTGIHTFVVNQDGQIFEKDLGKQSSSLQTSVRSFDPDSTWRQVDEH